MQHHMIWYRVCWYRNNKPDCSLTQVFLTAFWVDIESFEAWKNLVLLTVGWQASVVRDVGRDAGRVVEALRLSVT